MTTIGFLFFLSISGYLFWVEKGKRRKIELLRKKELSNQRIINIIHGQEIKTTHKLLKRQYKVGKQIASEIQDNIGTILTTLGMYTDSLLTKEKTTELRDIAERINNASIKAGNEVRKIAQRLDSDLLKCFDLGIAIQELMEAIGISDQMSIKSEVEISENVSIEAGLEIYLIIQELVNNSLKHSGCNSIRLEISEIDHELSIIYEDNGKGFDINQISFGMGLNNIEKRVDKLDGDIKIDSSPDKGSTFILEIPLA